MISSFLWRIVGWLRSRALWVTIGLICAVLLIWYFGPLLAIGDVRPLESVRARLWAIGLLFAWVLLRWAIRRWRASEMNGRIANVLRGTLAASPREDGEDVDKLRKRFDEALRILRKARFESASSGWFGRLLRQGRYVYELPWYVIIGAPGAGKTTALLNSGLSFPLAKQLGKSAVRGAGGTRHCDWWFTNEAVFIDTAGRYTTHETDAQADKAEWLGFLGLLKKHRARQPINGVLVTLSVSELLESPSEERLAHAATIRQRLDELRSALGVSFPVYVLVNKCDLLLGFDEYFSGLDRAGRDQVWGFTLPLDDLEQYALDAARIATEFELLQARIFDGLVDTLQAEPDLNHRALVYAFPQQFAILGEAIKEVVGAAFAESRYSTSPLLRGIYFTSGTQEGAPLDRALSALGKGFELRRAPRVTRGTPKSFFLQELLSRVVFVEAHLAGSNLRVDRKSRAFHVLAYTLCGAALIGSLAAWTVSYRNNLTYIAEVDNKAAALKEDLTELPSLASSNLFGLLPLLNVAETAADSAHFRVAEPLMPWTFGLYQGDKLGAGARAFYQRLLTERFAPTLKIRLEQLLRSVAVEDLEFAFEILKAYVMMHEPEHFNGEDFVAFILADWDYNMPSGSSMVERAAMERHVRALIEMDAVMPTTPMDSALVQATRSRLSQYSVSQRIYRRLTRVLADNPLPAFSVAAVVGPQAPTIFRRTSGLSLTDGVPSLYTFRGYHELFSLELDRALRFVGRDDSWVLGVSESAARDRMEALASGRLALEIKRHYMWDYVKYWENFLDDVDVVEPKSLGEAIELSRMLSSPDSPLSRYMQAVVKETTLSKEGTNATRSDASLFDRMRRSAQATREDLNRIVGPSMMPGQFGLEERPELIVDNRFEALRLAVQGGDQGGSTLLSSVQAFAELHMLLSATEAARIGGYPPPSSDLPARLRAEAARLPQPGRRLLESVAGNGATLVAREVRVAKGNELVGTVTRVCRETVEGRYPLARGAAKEVAIDDFTRMFGPGGRLDEYFQRELASAVDTSSSPWTLRAGAQGGLGGGASLAIFEKAHIIKDVFFRGGAGAPKVTVTLKPLVMDATITSLTLDIDGQVVRYQHGPQVAHTISWPGTRGSQQVRVSAEPPLAQGSSGMVKEGPWALHRLLDDAQIQPGASPERFTAVIDIGGRKASFEITASSVKNPFRLDELRSFSCPSGL